MALDGIKLDGTDAGTGITEDHAPEVRADALLRATYPGLEAARVAMQDWIRKTATMVQPPANTISRQKLQ